MDELCMCLWGETLWAVERASASAPEQIWWLKASRVFPVPDERNYLAGFLYKSNVNGQEIAFRPDEIVWQRYPNPLDEFSALSPVAAARLAADTGSAMMKANRNLHSQGLQIAGMVVPKQKDGMSVQFSAAQAEELEERLQKRFAGADKAHRWAVLRYEAEFHPVNISPKDAEFLGGLGLTLRQVCNAYGLPSPLLNDLEHATLANLREFQKALWEHGLVPDLTLRQEEIREQFLPMFPARSGTPLPNHVQYDFSGVAALQESQTEAWDRERQSIEVGAMTVNEWRIKHGMPRVAWGDVWWAPANKFAVKSATSAPSAESTQQPATDDDALAHLLAEPTWCLNGSHA
ncbi:MAG: phage portal protein, partial [Pseudonocardiaceae bacterium]